MNPGVKGEKGEAGREEEDEKVELNEEAVTEELVVLDEDVLA